MEVQYTFRAGWGYAAQRMPRFFEKDGNYDAMRETHVWRRRLFSSLFSFLRPLSARTQRGGKKKKEEDFLFHPLFLSFPRCLEPLFKLSVPGRGDLFFPPTNVGSHLRSPTLKEKSVQDPFLAAQKAIPAPEQPQKALAHPLSSRPLLLFV